MVMIVGVDVFLSEDGMILDIEFSFMGIDNWVVGSFGEYCELCIFY